MVEFESGHTGIRHKSYLWHDIITDEVSNQDSNDADEANTRPLTHFKAKKLASESGQ